MLKSFILVIVAPEHFPDTLTGHINNGQVKEPLLKTGRSLKELEREVILKTLDDMDGNRNRTAEILGISRRTLQLKLKDYKIKRK
jgi:two-component system response regulator HydG